MSSTGRKKRLPDLRINGHSILSPRKDDQSPFSNCGTGSPRRSSPEPNCSICLGRIEEKSFANRCFHSFCKTCLFEWSKVKPECPVCRQPFDSIISNVKAMDDYEEFFVEQPFPSYILSNFPSISRYIFPRNAGNPIDIGFLRESAMALQALGQVTRHRSRVTQNIREPSSRRHDIYFQWPPHSSSSRHRRGTTNESNRERRINNFFGFDISIPHPGSSFVPPVGTRDHRRYIYDHDLWVIPPSDGLGRECSASFYRKNPACIHRLVPWLNRELLALLDHEHEIERLLTQIKDSLSEHDIPSSRFRRIVEPFITEKTHHFLHELYHFARSRHEMEAYSRHAHYLPRDQVDVLEIEPSTTSRRFLVESSSSDSSSSDGDSVIEVTDLVDIEAEPSPRPMSLAFNYDTQETSGIRSEPSSTNNNVSMQLQSESTSEVNKKASHSDSCFVPVPTDVNIIEDFDNPTPGPSGLCRRNITNSSQLRVGNDDDGDTDSDIELTMTENHLSSKIEVQSDPDSEDSVKIVGYRKAIRERTPEIIELLSSSEDSCEPPSPRRKKLRTHRGIDKTERKSHKSRSGTSSPADSRHSGHRSKHKDKKRKHKKSHKRKRKSSTLSFNSSISRRVISSSESDYDSELRAKNPCYLPSLVIPKLTIRLSKTSENNDNGNKSS